MEVAADAAGHHVHDIHITDRARVQIGDQYYSGGLTINAKVGPLTEYTGIYAHNALAPVSTYVDRLGLRQKLEERLHTQIATPHHKTQTVVIHGIGGAGKTQLVLDYIQRHRQDYSAIFWIEATNPETIERDYVQIYVLLHGIHHEAGQDVIQLQHAVPAVKRWFYGRGGRWLFVFDNADAISNHEDPSYVDLRRFLPDDPCVHVIVTSRDRSAMEITELPAVEVDKMRPEEAVTLFQRQARMHPISSQQELQIGAIMQELGHLALAVTLAGSYVAATPRLRGDLTRYLPEYRVRRKMLLAQRPTWLVHQYGESVLTTWETTYRAIEGQNPGACQFLALLSFFNRDDIPADFPTINGEAPTWVSILFPGKQINEYDIEGFFRILTSFSLIKYQEDQGSYSMHSLIQAWAYDRLGISQQRHYGYVVALVLQIMTDAVKNENPITRGRCIPHVVSICQKITQCFESASVEDRFILALLNDLALFLNLCGYSKDEAEVERFIVRKHQLWYGEDHPNTLSSMNNLAITLGLLGELQEALSMKRVVLEKRQQILGEDHPDTLMSMYTLASTLRQVGELQEALSMQRAVLEKYKQILGEDHPDTLMSMNNLANTLRQVGELQEALSMQRVVLEKRQQILGEDHPDTLMSMNNLASTLRQVGELQEALSIQRAVLENYKQILGEDHPDTLVSTNNLANLLGDVGELQEALSMIRVVVEKRQQILGEDHPDTLMSMNNLANTLRQVGELQEALSIQRAVLENCKQILGEDHHNTLGSMNNLANILGDVGELQEALSMRRVVLEKQQQILGEDHPDTLGSMNNLASTLGQVGELQEALSIQRAVLEKYKRILNEDHPDTLESMNNLANILGDVGELQEALSMRRVVLEKRQQILGKDHPDTLGSMNNLAGTLGQVGELQEALSIQRKVVRKMTEILGAKHPYTAVSRTYLQQIETRMEELTMS